MKHFLIIFLAIFLLPILCFSQNVSNVSIPKVFDISGQFVFGRYINGEWKMPTKYNGKYKVYRREMLMGTATIKAVPNKAEEPCAPNFAYPEKFQDTDKIDYIAVEGTWNHLPRVPKKINTQEANLTKIVQEWCESKKIHPSNFQITEAVKIDIDNDKKDELIIAAKNIEHTFGPVENSFSVILIQKESKVIDICAFYMDSETAKHCSDETPCYANIYRFVMCLDIDNDGILEIITADEVHEGGGKTIYQWQGSTFIKILDWGCGV